MHPDNFLTGSFSLSKPIVNKVWTYTRCAGQSRKIKCSKGLSIEIAEATYGKIDGAECGNKAKATCGTESVLPIMKKKCDGKHFCKYKVTAKEFGDKCPDVNKALRVGHRCIDSSANHQCLNYDEEAKKFKFEKQTTPCTERFEWLDSNAIRHIKSKMCLNQYGRLMHNCYAYSSAYVKIKNGQLIRVASKDHCMGRAKDGGFTNQSCASATEIFFKQG